MKKLNRRGFLRTSAVTTAGTVISAPAVIKGLTKDAPALAASKA